MFKKYALFCYMIACILPTTKPLVFILFRWVKYEVMYWIRVRTPVFPPFDLRFLSLVFTIWRFLDFLTIFQMQTFQKSHSLTFKSHGLPIWYVYFSCSSNINFCINLWIFLPFQGHLSSFLIVFRLRYEVIFSLVESMGRARLYLVLCREIVLVCSFVAF